ncbi:O-methyltransferase [Streptomyces laculatispora]|uniref:O-methyltransferase n=1 Tax=Streptomyces laculatispora TaxID=887464 RepID=UPI0027DCD217|nr:class I SAM-dependent methyltransferase [Streptomyces laculatispora]
MLAELEARSRKEQQELEVLRAAGGTALRERAGSFMLDVGPEVGLFLNTLVRVAGARTVVEIGGSVGYSTVWLAEAVRATGGRLHSIEVDRQKQEEQRAYLTAAGLDAYVELTSREAPELVPSLSAPVDLVLLDHWKELYVRDFDACWPALRPGGVIVADNVLMPRKNAEVIARYRHHLSGIPDAQSQMLALGDGLEVTTKRENVRMD